jgi:hypothetical protein
MQANELLADPAELAQMARGFGAHPAAEALLWFGEPRTYLVAQPRFLALAKAECIARNTALVTISRADFAAAQQARVAQLLQAEHPQEDFSPATILSTEPTTEPTTELKNERRTKKDTGQNLAKK